MQQKKSVSPLTNSTNTFSAMETTGGMSVPPQSDASYEAYQDLIDMQAADQEAFEDDEI